MSEKSPAHVRARPAASELSPHVVVVEDLSPPQVVVEAPKKADEEPQSEKDHTTAAGRWSWTTIAFVLAFLSLVLTLVAMIIGLVLAMITHSSAMLGFALENAVDFLSSILVCWRFYSGASEEALELREKRASVGIGISFVVLACVVASTAAEHLTEQSDPEYVELLIALAAPSAALFGPLGLLKLWVGFKTNSASMKKDGLCSIFGTILSLGVIVGVVLYGADEKLWYADAVVALCVAVLLLIIGVDTLVRNAYKQNRYWTVAFWTGETSKPPPEVTAVGVTPSQDEKVTTPNEVQLEGEYLG